MGGRTCGMSRAAPGEGKGQKGYEISMRTMDHTNNFATVDGYLAPPALYLHVPYCRSRCTYCDFNAYQLNTEADTAFSDYADALILDIENGEFVEVASIFWGGGTPSLMPASELSRIVEVVKRKHPLIAGGEHTIEANPGTVTPELFDAYLKVGINRLSMGAQAFQKKLLTLIGRVHTDEQVETSFAAALRAGFENISLDLIYGFPHQTVGEWRESLQRALALRPEHLSIYQLTVEPATRLEVQLAKGELELPPEDDMIAMDDLSEELLSEAGYSRYEISNWALPGRECRHNLKYWADAPYIGRGCGAVSFLNGWRIERIKPPNYYQRALREGRSPVVFAERRGADGALKDLLMMGLRVKSGLPWSLLEQRFPTLQRSQVEAFLARLPQEWWVLDDSGIRLTRKGWDFHSNVTMELMDVMFSF